MSLLTDTTTKKVTPPSLLEFVPIEITTLHNLATDCLHLSMHFFHPIQQSAQQIYHTALPLSPTSSYLQRSCLQSVTDDQLSHVTAFIGAPSTWGLLLRTIDIRPRQLTCITTSGQEIIAGCGDIVNIYDAVTGVLQQSLFPSKAVRKIQASPDGSTLFFAHSSSVTMWDVQTGGLIHTFATGPEVNDIAVSTTGDHVTCGSSDGSVRFWNTRTKKEGKRCGDGQSVVTICWLSPRKFVVATQNSLYIRDVTTDKTLCSLSIPDRVWGMVSLQGEDGFLVGTSQSGSGISRELYALELISSRDQEPLDEERPTVNPGWPVDRKLYRGERLLTHLERLTRPTIVGDDIACITPPSGVQSFNTESYDWTNKPPLLDAATSVAVSLNRNLVAQTKDSIQIFSIDVLASREVRNEVRPSQIYSLGKKHILCVLQPTRDLALLELETLRALHPGDDTLPFGPFPYQTLSARATFGPGLVAKLDILTALWTWQSGGSLPTEFEVSDEDTSRPLYGLSPACTKVVTVSSWPTLYVHDAKDRTELAQRSLRDDILESGKVYDLTFDSDTRLYLKINGPGWHVQIPYEIIPSSHPYPYPYDIIKGEPVPLPEPRAAPPYTLDANCEWVLDKDSRRICWISPGNVRRGNGGHFWVGSSLVMVGDDGVVRKVSFKEPDC